MKQDKRHKDEALKMAIKEIEEWIDHAYGSTPEECADNEVIKACKEALDTEQVRKDTPTQEPVDGCRKCHACLVGVNDESGLPITATQMILCPACGNKRCPHASNHRYACTNSNDTNQIGSIYRTHPAPEWQGLSDDEIESLDFRKNYMETYHDTDDDGCYFDVDTFEHKFAKAIEQKLKEKNHGTT